MDDEQATFSKMVGLLWLAGFREACALNRVALCFRSRDVSIKMGQCFLLNGLIFLGSLFMMNSFVVPILEWILPARCEDIVTGHGCSHHSALAFYSFLRYILTKLFYVLWFYPLYAFSFVLSALWYNDIAKHGFDTIRRKEQSLASSSSVHDNSASQNVANVTKSGGFEAAILGIGQQVYSLLLLNVFLIEVVATGFIPYIGKAINFLLLSLMYSYYCFEYKWNLSELSLEKRLDLFETNWAFFVGFGSPCVIAIFFFSPLVSYGIMAILFPLFVLAAAASQAEQVIDSYTRRWCGSRPRRLHIFYFANSLSLQVLKCFPESHRGG